jgi:glycosyltransferase involved in cell wall biosynthesis
MVENDKLSEPAGDRTPLLSVGMPVYNGERYLRDALDSLLAQSFSDFEVIISDNASTDKTREICEAYQAKHSRIRYYPNQVNRGAAWNYNRVFHLASAAYFKWAAHDDMLAPDFLEKCVQVLDQEPEVVLVYPGSLLFEADGRQKGVYFDGLDLRDEAPHIRFRDFLARPGLCHAVFGVMRSAALSHTALIGNYPRSDRNLLGELSLSGKFYEIPEKLFYRRVHSQISTEENVTEYQLAVWFDPAKRGKLVFPRWRRLVEYLRAIFRARISVWEKILSILELARFLFVPSRVQGLLDDLKILSARSSEKRTGP